VECAHGDSRLSNRVPISPINKWEGSHSKEAPLEFVLSLLVPKVRKYARVTLLQVASLL
jgi:hypothetical protein